MIKNKSKWNKHNRTDKTTQVTKTISSSSPVSSLRSRKNFWLKMKATPLISSTLASAVVFLLMKLAVMAIASLPRNSFLLKPETKNKKGILIFLNTLVPLDCRKEV